MGYKSSALSAFQAGSLMGLHPCGRLEQPAELHLSESDSRETGLQRKDEEAVLYAQSLTAGFST